MRELLIFTAVIFLSRFLGLDNFTPVLAFALLTPNLTKNTYLQYALPLGIMLLSDPLLGGYSTATPFVYLAIASCTLIGSIVSNHAHRIVLSGATWHLFMLPTTLLHPDSSYLLQVQADLVVLAGTVVTYYTIIGIRNFVEFITSINPETR